MSQLWRVLHIGTEIELVRMSLSLVPWMKCCHHWMHSWSTSSAVVFPKGIWCPYSKTVLQINPKYDQRWWWDPRKAQSLLLAARIWVCLGCRISVFAPFWKYWDGYCWRAAMSSFFLSELQGNFKKGTQSSYWRTQQFWQMDWGHVQYSCIVSGSNLEFSR